MSQRPWTAILIIFLFLISAPFLKQVSAGQQSREPVPLPVWREEIVAPGVYFYSLGNPALALDPAGNPHLVYGHNHLFHSWFDGAAWQSETLDTTRASTRESVLAITPAGTIIIADINDGKLFARTKTAGGTWQTTRVPLPYGTHVTSLTLALDSKGEPHIAAGADYSSRQSFFIYAWHTPFGWQVEKVETGEWVDVSLALDLDSQDRALVLYGQVDDQYDTNEMWLAQRSGASWQHEKLAEASLFAGKALVVDRQDKPHIVFSKDYYGDLIYLHKNKDGWQSIAVTDNGFYADLAVDRIGRPHVAYSSNQGQVYASLYGTSWDKALIEQAGRDTGIDNTLLLDHKGAAHIASLSYGLSGGLHYATNRHGQWHSSRAAWTIDVGRQSALALDSADNPYAFYHDGETQELFWRSRGEDGWTAELVAAVPAEDLEVAALMDSQDRPTIATVDASQNKLLVGSRETGAWVFEPLGPAGRQLSLAAGADDRPQLLLIQNDALKYWTKDGENWISETVASPDPLLVKAFLAIDSQNRPHAVYSNSKGSLYVMRESAEKWTAEMLPFETVEGLLLDDQDQPHVLYSEISYESQGRYPIEITSLWYARREGDGWLSEILWEEEYWTPEAELVLDAQKQVTVAFSSLYGGVQVWLRDPSGAWQRSKAIWPGEGNISLALGQDEQPRLLYHDGSSLLLARREIAWLDKFSLMPLIGGQPD